MAARRKVEVFSAGCALCDEAVATVQRLAASSTDVQVLDMRDAQVANRARALGIHAVPAVVIDGQLASCCAGRDVDEQVLRAAGIDQP
ncbi:hypothetical protein DF016_10810 [Burkholderia stagnalis]|uniref:Thioredoxin-like fold domain-containing protein n=1 Tax=Burkholderia stagnalis TaxID=1503054 RepID=A0ABX9YQH4_9BURK|nr:thioredoxin family protein [Burkholderia stagnalis]RQY93823.1 hypothetical protein DF017_12390 [Burkholderia stagnalis]RQZ19545.1 hypothetical protein DF016_10810 [Burkholderia stagnalis]